MIDIVLATHNSDKQLELTKALNSQEVNILSLQDFPEIEEIIEDGKTLKDNALIKARTVYKITGLLSISDDTGLEVDALDGQPGIFTARYAGENCSYIDNINKMLKEMRNIPEKENVVPLSKVEKFPVVNVAVRDILDIAEESMTSSKN